MLRFEAEGVSILSSTFHPCDWSLLSSQDYDMVDCLPIDMPKPIEDDSL